MNTTSNPTPPAARRPGLFESYGVLGDVLAQASAVPGCAQHLIQVGFTQAGTIGISSSDPRTCQALAARLALTPATTPPGPVPQDGPVQWSGRWAGHLIVIRRDAAPNTRPTPAPTPAIRTPRPVPAKRVPVAGARERSPRFQARFPSTCPQCDQDIQEGEDVAWLDSDVVHEDCAADAGVEVFGR